MSLDLENELIDGRILRAVKDMGFTEFSPIQQQAIPHLLEGKDIIGQAQTGTGKTAAFGIPTIQKIDPENRKLQAIILCPTRELAIQAAEEIRKLAKYMHGIKVLPIYGGADIGRQINGLKGVQIVVGTPGRVMDHMRRHTIKMDDVKMVVLDEADEMLNMGFREDMELILGEIENEHQTALFSATMPKPILEITGKFQKDAELVKVAAQELTIPLVSQRYYRIKNHDKDAATVRLLEYYQPKLCLIFCNTKKKVDELTGFLKAKDFQAEGLHGDLSQYQRDVAMGRFRNGTTNILIATDVAARGIDVDDVEAVINYDIPQDIEYYVHRIGRTGRAGRTGRSFTFISGREIYKLREIERVCHTTIEEKTLPTASKVMRVKAEKAMAHALLNKESDDFELMKKFISKKMEEEELDALDMAAAFLKCFVGEIGEDIAVEETPRRKEKHSGRGRDDRRDGGRRDRRDGDRSRRDGDRSRRDGERTRRDERADGDRRRKDSRKEDRRGERRSDKEQKRHVFQVEKKERRPRKEDVRRDGSPYTKGKGRSIMDALPKKKKSREV